MNDQETVEHVMKRILRGSVSVMQIILTEAYSFKLHFLLGSIGLLLRECCRTSEKEDAGKEKYRAG